MSPEQHDKLLRKAARIVTGTQSADDGGNVDVRGFRDAHGDLMLWVKLNGYGSIHSDRVSPAAWRAMLREAMAANTDDDK